MSKGIEIVGARLLNTLLQFLKHKSSYDRCNRNPTRHCTWRRTICARASNVRRIFRRYVQDGWGSRIRTNPRATDIAVQLTSDGPSDVVCNIELFLFMQTRIFGNDLCRISVFRNRVFSAHVFWASVLIKGLYTFAIENDFSRYWYVSNWIITQIVVWSKLVNQWSNFPIFVIRNDYLIDGKLGETVFFTVKFKQEMTFES